MGVESAPPTSTATTGLSGESAAVLDVFVSYARDDAADFAKQLVAALEARNRTAWLDTEDLVPGAEWEKRIYPAIERARAFAYVVSEKSIASEWCIKEFAHAQRSGKRVFPLVYRAVPPSDLPEGLAAWQFISFEDGVPFSEAVDQLVSAIDIDQEWVDVHTRLLTRAVEWRDNRYDGSYVLRGRDLKEAERWLVAVAPEKRPQPTTLQREYVNASRAAATRWLWTLLASASIAALILLAVTWFALVQQSEAVVQRNAAERSGAAAVAAASTAAASEAIAVRSGATAVAESAMRAAAEATAVTEAYRAATAQAVAEDRRQEAEERRRETERERQVAIARQLAAQAEAVRSQEPELLPRSMILAVEAMRRLPSAEAEQALRRGLALTPRPVANLVYEDTGSRPRVSPSEGRFALVLSADGRYLALGSRWSTRRVQVWDTTTGREAGAVSGVGSVAQLDLSPDGTYLAVANTAGLVRVLDWSSGRDIVSNVHADNGVSISFSRGGEYVAVRYAPRQILVADLATGQELPGAPPEDDVKEIGFSPLGTYLVVGTGSGTQLVEVRTGRTIMRAPGIFGPVVTPDERRLVAIGRNANGEASAQTWDIESAREVTSVTYPDQGSALTLSPDGRYLAGHSRYGNFWAIDAFTGHEVVGTGTNVTSVTELNFSADSRFVAVSSRDGTARVWELADGREVARVKHDDAVHGVKISPDGARFVSISGVRLLPSANDRPGDNTIRVWETATGRELARLRFDAGEVLAFPDGRRLLTRMPGDRDGPRFGAAIWDIVDGSAARLVHDDVPDSIVTQLDVSHDGAYVLARLGSYPRWGIRLWDLRTGHPVPWLFRDEPATAATFSPDGQRLLTLGPGKTVRTWELATGRQISTFTPPSEVDVLALSPDAQHVLAGPAATGDPGIGSSSMPWIEIRKADDGEVITRLAGAFDRDTITFAADGRYLIVRRAGGDQIWEAASGMLVTRLDAGAGVPTFGTRSVSTPDGRYLATTWGANVVRVWSLPGQSVEVDVTGDLPEQRLWTYDFSPTGRYLVTSHGGEWPSTYNVLTVLDAATWTVVARLRHEGVVNRVAFSADDRYLATQEDYRTVRLWELPGGRQVGRISEGEVIWAIALSPDGRQIITGNSGVVRIWSWQQSDLVAEACARLLRNLTMAEWRQYVGDEPYRKTCPALPGSEGS